MNKIKFSFAFFVMVVVSTIYFSGQGLHAQTKLSLDPENPPGYVPPTNQNPNGQILPAQNTPAPALTPAPDINSLSPQQAPGVQPDRLTQPTIPQQTSAGLEIPPPPTPEPTATPETTFQDPGDISKAVSGAILKKSDANAPITGPSYPASSKQNTIVSVTKPGEEKKLFAVVSTSEGSFKIKLFPQYVPRTVKNFTDLATGQKEFVEAATSRKSTRPFYNGQIIFKVVRDFVIQMGCPFGDGRGGPGYEILDEFTPYLHHDKEGVVSMANHGPNTAGSQFFITLGPQPSFDNKYSAFGQVVSGMDVVRKISKVRTGPTSRPLKRIVIQKIEIEGIN